MAYLIYFCAVILPWVMGLGLCSYLIFAKNKLTALRLILLAFFGALVAWFLANLWKYNFPSPRPFEVYANLKPLFATGRGDAFPSGHATFMGALAVSVFLQNRRLGLVFIAGAIVIAITRVLAYVHWPIDMIVGLIFGGLVSAGIWLIYHRILVE